MLMILSTLITGLLGQFPLIMQYMGKAQDFKNQVELLKLQSQLKISEADHAALVDAVKSAVAERESVRSHDSDIQYPPSIMWLRASIRPLVTYMFLALWLVVKASLFYQYYNTMTWTDTVSKVLWDPPTQAMFETIMAFWFGSRLGEKLFEKASKK